MVRRPNPDEQSTRCRTRFRVAAVTPGRLRVVGEVARYLRNVLRAHPGQQVEIFDGEGQFATAQIELLRRGEVTLFVDPPQREPPPTLSLIVGLSPPKQERADWAVEKLTEVGVSRIIWVECERSVRQPKDLGARHQRWARLAEAAAGQSGRATIPTIEGPISLARFADVDADTRWIGDAHGPCPTTWCPSATPFSAALLLGPEGGFSAAELARADQSGFTRIGLGPWTLRVETAAVVGAGLLNALGNRRGPEAT